MPALEKPVFESRAGEAPEAFKRKYAYYLEQCRNDSRGFEVLEAFRASHPDRLIPDEPRNRRFGFSFANDGYFRIAG